MNISQIWAYGRAQLLDSPTPDLDARLLLGHLLGVSQTYLIAYGERLLSAEEESRYRALIKRARQKEPIPYLIGHAPCFGLEFQVTPDVLIPRPETEQLLDLALAWAKPRQPLNAVDVGTGSGCIAVCLAAHLPQATVQAVDISPGALAVARHNAQQHVEGRIQFHQGDLLTPIQGDLDLIVANLPYITESEWTMLDDGVKLYEPEVALKGGDDGLDLIRNLLRQAKSKLNPGGAIFLEIGWKQGSDCQQVAQAYFPAAQTEMVSDYAGNDRIVVVTTG